jgi:lipoyl-dependent peroxiredoxin
MFEGAMVICVRKMRIRHPEDTAIDSEADLCIEKGEYFLQARVNVSVPGLDREIMQQLIYYAEQTYPYSKAIRNNVVVEVNPV